MPKKYKPNLPFYEFADKPFTEEEKRVADIGKRKPYKPYPDAELADIMVIQVLSVDKKKKAQFMREVEKAAIRLKMSMNKKVLEKRK